MGGREHGGQFSVSDHGVGSSTSVPPPCHTRPYLYLYLTPVPHPALLRASRFDRVQTCSAQAGNAIVYECIQTIMAVESESGPYTMRTPPPPHSRPSHMGHSSMYTRIALAVTTKDRESLRHP